MLPPKLLILVFPLFFSAQALVRTPLVVLLGAGLPGDVKEMVLLHHSTPGVRVARRTVHQRVHVQGYTLLPSPVLLRGESQLRFLLEIPLSHLPVHFSPQLKSYKGVPVCLNKPGVVVNWRETISGDKFNLMQYALAQVAFNAGQNIMPRLRGRMEEHAAPHAHAPPC